MSYLKNIFLANIDSLTEEQLWDNYVNCLRSHDWYYEYSDDSRYYWTGKEERERIAKLKDVLSKIDKEKATTLYDSFRRS